MMGPGHRMAGAASWVFVATSLHLAPPLLVGGMCVAVAFSHGKLSPDVDQTIKVHGRKILHHRGITHWWTWPVVVAVLAEIVYLHWGVTRGMWPLAVAVGWASHLAADFLFGWPGIPVWPKLRNTRSGGRWHYMGLRLFRADGMPASIATAALALATGWMLLGQV